MAWRVAKALLTLQKQLDAMYPDRKKPDEFIGNAEHQSRSSDHNAWIVDTKGGRVVSAGDFKHDPANGFDTYLFADWLREKRDPRIKYVISNSRIMGDEGYASRNRGVKPWTWYDYHGPNPHDLHMHISVNSKEAQFDSQAAWDIGQEMPAAPPVKPLKPDRPMVKLGSTGDHVAYLQRMLGISANSMFDQATEIAVIEFQKRYGLEPDGKVGPYTWRQLEA